MIAIFKRELEAYFNVPLGYVFLAVYQLLTGYFFLSYNLYSNTTDMRPLFETLFVVTLFLIPVLTMRLMSEDRRAKIDRLLLMAPVSSQEVILGKFLAAATVYLIALAIAPVQAFVLSRMAAVEWSVVLGHVVGLFLLGCALIALGLFLSSLTESQIIAAVGGFCIGFFLMMLDSLGSLLKNSALSGLVLQLSFRAHYRNLTLGVMDLADIVFYLSITAMFLIFSQCVFEKRRLV